MKPGATAIELSELSLMDLGAVALTTLIILLFLGPKLWAELRNAKGLEG